MTATTWGHSSSLSIWNRNGSVSQTISELQRWVGQTQSWTMNISWVSRGRGDGEGLGDEHATSMNIVSFLIPHYRFWTNIQQCRLKSCFSWRTLTDSGESSWGKNKKFVFWTMLHLIWYSGLSNDDAWTKWRCMNAVWCGHDNGQIRKREDHTVLVAGLSSLLLRCSILNDLQRSKRQHGTMHEASTNW